MPVYQPSDPFGFGSSNSARPNQYRRYEHYSGFPYAQYMDIAAQMGGMYGAPGLNSGINSQVNLYGNLSYQKYTQQHSAALLRASEADTAQFMNIARGASIVAGQPFGQQQQQDALNWRNRLGDLAVNVDNPMVMRMYDAAHGGRSSLPMAHYMHTAGSRFMRDPMTGMAGLSANSSVEMAKMAQQRFFSGNDLQASGGLTSPEMGEMFQELASTGRLPGLSRAMDPKVDKMSRQDAGRAVNNVLERYARVLGTMKEIFIGEGQSNTPMSQLMDAAEALTGGLNQMSSREAESRIRNIHNSAKSMGLGMDAVVGQMRVASAITQGFGLNDAFALPVAGGGLDFRTALGMTGALENPAWGLRSADQLQQQHMTQTAGFIASESGNRLGMLHRMAARHFGNAEGGIDAARIQGNSQAARAMRALATGDYNNQELSGLLAGNESDFINQIAGTIGTDAGTIGMELQFGQQNQEAIFRNNLQRFGTAAQSQELKSLLFGEGSGAGPFGMPTHSLVGKMLGDNAMAGEVAADLTTVSRDTLFGMKASDRGDAVKRRNSMASAMRGHLENMAAGDGPQAAAARQMLEKMGASDLGVAGSLGALAEQQYASAENFGMTEGLLVDPTTGKPVNLINYLQSLDPAVAAEQEAASARSGVRSRAESQALGVIDPGGMISRAIGALRKAGESGEGNTTDVIKAALGIDVNGEQASKMAEILRSMDTDMTALEEEKKRLAASPTDANFDRYNQLQDAIQQEQASWQAFLEDPANAGVREAIAKAAAGEQSPTGEPVAGGGGGGGSTWHLSGVTININGQPLVANSGGDGKVNQSTRGGGPVP